MVTKENLKDWLDVSSRSKYAKKLEEYIDSKIKINALDGKTTFYISAGRYTRDGSTKTPFYDLWYTGELSETNRKLVHDLVINRYREFGFNVSKTSVDCGWNNNYFALEFKDIDKVLQQ
ncbi:hypothetical protein [Lederbergia galactosidilytica]|uniref:Uncharacterized protein n=1 Tax=Lederbergia galactosidilytica TaxID=217031 RepID=A0A177ZQ04_9BACI|nr:hypothetical protein [Lederbergia galactosidilytica]OAK70056.1 hypothetical protein ABB05_12790 [Lederbergia galactosidilytica]